MVAPISLAPSARTCRFVQPAVETWTPEYLLQHWDGKKKLAAIATGQLTNAGKHQFRFIDRVDPTRFNRMQWDYDAHGSTGNITSMVTVAHDTRPVAFRQHINCSSWLDFPQYCFLTVEPRWSVATRGADPPGVGLDALRRRKSS